MKSLPAELAKWLRDVRMPGDFYAAGMTSMPLPRLDVAGVGPIALPLLSAQAAQLIAVAERAPYGRGEQTIVDTEVRRTWQIGAAQVRLTGKSWDHALQAMVERAALGLGVGAPVIAELYKLLLYDAGSFFACHRDTEKSPGMFATLIVVLPSLHSGGELLVRHDSRQVRLDLCGDEDDPSQLPFAAFYADCVHEVLPVRTGCRLALVYNLLLRDSGNKKKEKKLPRPPSYATEQTAVAALLQRWAQRNEAATASDTDAVPEKLVWPLEHAYTPAELLFAALKGPDAARAAVLAAAAEEAGCELHVALLTTVESGAAEETGYSGRHWKRRYDDDEEDGEDAADVDDEGFEIVEVCERVSTLSHWARPDGTAPAMPGLPLEDAEVSPPDALQDLIPDEQYFQEATGNEGASFERTYRRAALVLWPRQRRLAVLNQAGLSATLPHLGELAQRWTTSGAAPDSTLWQQAHELAGHMLRSWPRGGHFHFEPDERPGTVGTMLALLVRLQDTAQIEAMLGDVVAADNGLARADTAAVVQAARVLPAQRAGELIERIVAGNATHRLAACGDLLARAARVGPLVDCGSLAAAAAALVDALPGDPKRVQPSAAGYYWRRPPVEAGFIVDLMSALARIVGDAPLADRAAAYLLAWPITYGLDTVLLPALRQLRQQRAEIFDSNKALQRLRAAGLEHLRTRAAQPLAPPADWSRSTASGCNCERCQALNKFLRSPDEPRWIFKAVETERAHVLDSIRRGHCDVDCTTDKRGRPYSLVCVKNQASYEQLAAQRKQDLEDLTTLA